MQNPYAASNLSAEPAADGRKRRPVWKSLLIAYAVHHVAGVAGFYTGYIYTSGVSLLFNSASGTLLIFDIGVRTFR